LPANKREKARKENKDKIRRSFFDFFFSRPFAFIRGQKSYSLNLKEKKL